MGGSAADAGDRQSGRLSAIERGRVRDSQAADHAPGPLAS
jgi:hypothetical protein